MGVALAQLVELIWTNRIWAAILATLGMWGFGVETLALARDPLLSLKDAVITQGIPYEETLYSLKNSWMALQFRSLYQWSTDDIDALILRSLISWIF